MGEGAGHGCRQPNPCPGDISSPYQVSLDLKTTEPGAGRPMWESITEPGDMAISQAGWAVTFFWKGIQRY